MLVSATPLLHLCQKNIYCAEQQKVICMWDNGGEAGITHIIQINYRKKFLLNFILKNTSLYNSVRSALLWCFQKYSWEYS